MAKEKLSEELKLEIKNLSNKEKDQLLLRLIPTNEILVRQLEFKLLEKAATSEVRRMKLEDLILEELSKKSEYYDEVYFISRQLSAISGQITRHVRITGDKIGDIELNLLMIHEVFKRHHKILKHSPSYVLDKVVAYICKRLVRVQKQIDKLHEDYQLDFQEITEDIESYIMDLPDFRLYRQFNNIKYPV